MALQPIPVDIQQHLFAQMVLIRRFEEKIIDLCQKEGCLSGMQILAVGQEAVAAGIVAALDPDDVIVSNHRSHGHLLARGADPSALMAEIMGKADGVGARQGRHPASVRTRSQCPDDLHGGGGGPAHGGRSGLCPAVPCHGRCDRGFFRRRGRGRGERS